MDSTDRKDYRKTIHDIHKSLNHIMEMLHNQEKITELLQQSGGIYPAFEPNHQFKPYREPAPVTQISLFAINNFNSPPQG